MYNFVELCDYGNARDVLIISCNSDKAKDKIAWQGEKTKLNEVIEILQGEDSTRQTLTEMNSTIPVIERNLRVVGISSNSKIILLLLNLLLVGRNKMLQVPASSAATARKPTPRGMKMSAKQAQPSVMGMIPLDITRELVRSQVTSHRNPIQYRPWKEQLDIQLHQQKVYFAIQFCQQKRISNHP